MTLSTLFFPALLVAGLPSVDLAPSGVKHSLKPDVPNEYSDRQCEMEEAKLMLLVPEEKHQRDVQFRPDDNRLCLYYLSN